MHNSALCPVERCVRRDCRWLCSDPRGVHELTEKIPGNDAIFVVDKFEQFLNASLAVRTCVRAGQKKKIVLVHACMHACTSGWLVSSRTE